MKRLLALVLSLLFTITLFGCNSQDSNTDNLKCFTSYNYHKDSMPDLEMSQEQMEYIINIWNSSSWENDITKTLYNYVFIGDNIEIRYCYNEGIFNDVINNRHIVLSDEAKMLVNEVIDNLKSPF